MSCCVHPELEAFLKDELRLISNLSESDRARLVVIFQAVINKIRNPNGFVPICSVCKDVRDDQGKWQKVETFLLKYAEFEFTHGLCPVCLKGHYSEYSDDKTVEFVPNDRDAGLSHECRGD